jgi:mannan endo-1,4-beta-mannosidase
MWKRWQHHPYNAAHGGPCAARNQLLTSSAARLAIKGRLAFAIDRWGGSGALFAWDLWNEIHPAHGGNSTQAFHVFVSELSEHLRSVETRLYGRAHLQTVSLFGPVLEEHPDVAEVVFRHPHLDFATTHFYDARTINHPRDTVAPALRAGALVSEALGHLPAMRPFMDSEHGPIHAFKDLERTLPEPFDDEYFRHIQWAHLAAGGAGGGMRWPNRHPHVLTAGMRKAQRDMAGFLGLVRWPAFRRRNLNAEIELSTPAFAVFGCGDAQQAVVWLLRQDRLKKGMIDPAAPPVPCIVTLPGLAEGMYSVHFWDTTTGTIAAHQMVERKGDAELQIEVPPVRADIALAVVRES